MNRLLTALFAVLSLLSLQPAMAAVKLTPIYANEASNWPLETFAANGLFRQIAHYQQGHPQAIVLNSGEYSLDQLAQQLGPRTLSHSDTGWTLHYPLVIGPGARLTLSDSNLYIEGRHGGCLINRGELVIEHSTITSNGDRSSGFIHGWGGSTTRILNSALIALGRADYRANGVSVARHRYQDSGAPARLYIVDSQFRNLYRGLDAEAGSQVSISGLTVSGSREQGLVLQSSRARIERLVVSNAGGHGLRAGGYAALDLKDSVLRHNAGSGILLENHNGEVHISSVTSENNLEYGAQIKSLRGQHTTLMKALTLRNNGSDGLRLDGSMEVSIEEANISHNQRYAISIQAAPGHEVNGSMSNLRLHKNHLAALQTRGEGKLEISGVSLRHASNRGKYLAGNLADQEADVLPPLLQGKKVAIRFTEMLPTSPLASLQ